MAQVGGSTGQYWRCPQCQKLVPVRSLQCRCGFSREGLRGMEVIAPGRAATEDTPRRSWLPWLAIPACGVLAYFGIANWQEQDVKPMKRLVVQRVQPAPPQFVILPPPGSPPSPDPRTATSSPTDQAQAPAVEPTTDAGSAPQSGGTPTTAPQSDPGPRVSGLDRQRETGTREFEIAIARLASKADQVDVLWGRWRNACENKVTVKSETQRGDQITVSNSGRAWFGVWESTTVSVI